VDSVVLQFGGAGSKTHGTFGSAHLCLARRSGPIAECLVGNHAVGSFSCMCSRRHVFTASPRLRILSNHRSLPDQSQSAANCTRCRRALELPLLLVVEALVHRQRIADSILHAFSWLEVCQNDAVWWGMSRSNLPMDLGS
jgi:hypothetical protein